MARLQGHPPHSSPAPVCDTAQGVKQSTGHNPDIRNTKHIELNYPLGSSQGLGSTLCLPGNCIQVSLFCCNLVDWGEETHHQRMP